METVFPEQTGYSAMFLVGYRKNPATNVIEQVGVAILKRTYTITPATGALSPADTPLPVFQQDQPDNPVKNADFQLALTDDDSNYTNWIPDDGVTIALFPETPDNEVLQVDGPGGRAVVQTIAFEEPLGGRSFWFSLDMRSTVAATNVFNIRLEADDIPICTINATLGTSMVRSSAIGTFPEDVTATELQVILPTVGGRTVFYDNVQVEERPYLTQWQDSNPLYFEHDMAAFKPEADVIVPGYTSGVNGTCSVRVDGALWLQRPVTLAAPVTDKALFGWESRSSDQAPGDARKMQAGTYAPPHFVSPDILPDDFDNRFFNGYLRSAVQTSPFPYLGSRAQVEIGRTSPASVYRMRLNGESVSAAYETYEGGEDAEANWTRHTLTMQRDTLVIEPDRHRCYLVWRGVWPFEQHPQDSYRRLTVTANR